MNVDTGDLSNLVAEVAALCERMDQVTALGRKVTALTGRVTALGNRVRDVARLGEIVTGSGHEAEYQRMLSGARSGATPRHARPRHLTVVRGGRGRT